MKGSKLQRKFRDVCIPAALLAITFGICGPIQLYLTNIQELWFSIKDIWWLCLLGGAALFLVCAGIGVLLPQKITRYYGAAVFGVALGLYVQGNFIPTDYGVMDGGEIDWSAYQGTAVVNSLIWAICILVPLALAWKKASFAKQVARIGSLLVIAMQVATVGILLATNNFGINQSQGVLTTEGINDVSSQENVVVFIVDRFDEEYFQEIYEKDRGFMQPLDGFVWFDNATGMYPTTKGALPYILTQQAYQNEQPYREYIEEAFQNTDYYSDLKQNGYDVGVYTLPVFMPSYADQIFLNYSNSDICASSDYGLATTLYKFTGFRYLPHCLKKYVWFYSGEFDKWKQVKSSSQYGVYSQDNLDYYRQLVEKGLQLTDQKKCYRLIHISGVHPPYTMNEALQEVKNGSSSWWEAARGSLKIVYEYLEQLKSLGVYDNTTIMIIADHGSGGDRPTNPLFLFKPQQSVGELEINSAPVCQEDLFATVMEDIGLNKNQKYGVSAVDIPEDSERERFFMFYTWDDAWDSDYLPQMTTYGVLPQSNDAASYFPINYVVNPYTLDTPVSFGASGNSTQYTISGFSVPEQNFTWSAAQKAVMAFDLQETPTQNLLVNINWNHVITPDQRMIVKSNETVLYDQKVEANGLAAIWISKDLVNGTELKLNFEFPNAVSPNELNGSDDFRTLSVAFTDLMISQTDLTQAQAIAMSEGITAYELGTALQFGSGREDTNYFTIGISEPENGFVWSLGETSEMKLAVGEVSQQLTAEISVAGTIDANQTIRISAQGVNLYDAPVPAGKSTIQFDIPASCIENGVLTLEFSYPNAVAPNHIDTQSNDTRVLSVRYSSMKISAQSE